MISRKTLSTLLFVLVLASLIFGSASQLQPVSAMPASATDETKVPHYFGPYPNWANSPFALQDAQVVITGDGSGAQAVASVGANGAILDITVTNPGHNYSHAKVDILGSGTGALADATIVKKGAVVAVTVNTPGSGYTAPVVSFSGNGGAAATAYGGVDVIAISSGGFGYTFPTVDFDMPDGPNGVQAQAHVVMDAFGTITAVVIDNPGSGYSTAPNIVIRDGTIFDPINHDPGTFGEATATSSLSIQEIALDAFGSGYNQAPTVTITDPTGTGATATAALDNGIIAAITLKKAGTGYIQAGGIQKFTDPLPGLCTPPACPVSGKYIPLAVPEVKAYNGVEADEYVIGLVQYRTSFSSSMPPTLVRGYIQLETAANAAISQHYPVTNELLDGTQVPVYQSDGVTQWLAVTPPQFLGPTIAATKDRPVRIVFYNLLPTGTDGDLFLPTDSSLMGSGMGPMAGMPDPVDQGSVMDEVRNPLCTEYPKSDMCFKDNRATLHLHGGITPWISDGTPHQWITPANEMTPWPQGVSVQNVPDMDVCTTANDGCQTFYYTNQQSARLMFYHDHAWGITRLNVYAGEAAGYIIADNTEQTLISNGVIPGATDTIPLIIQDRTFVPDTAQLAAQDPTWDTARWGGYGNFWYHHVYMPAQNPGDPSGMSAYGRWMYGPWFWPPALNTVHGPISNPYYNMDPKGPDGIPGTTDDWTTPLAVPCNLDDPATWQYQTDPFCEPEQIPGTPNISVGMEQFNDTPIVNGVAYPTLTLEPKTYRLRILNAANDRFFNFQWYVGDPTTASTSLNSLGQVIGATEVALNPTELAAAQIDPNVFPTPVQGAATTGPDWIQIGTEGGFLPAPVVVDGQQVTTWITDPTRFDVGNVDKHSLLLAPAERGDVIVDFSQFAGKTLILYNDAPAAFPARVASYDYYTGAPDLSPVGAPTILPGYGPNTRTIMQIKITANPPAPAFSLSRLQAAFKHNASGTGAFESGQHPIIVGQAAYNSAYGTSFAASSNCNVPGSTLQRCDGYVRVNDTSVFGFNTLRGQSTKMTLPLQPKAIHDEMNATTFDEFGRMQANLGVEAQPPIPGAQNVVLYPYVNPQTELIDATGLPVGDINVTPISSATDGTQIWRITHNGVDTHPIHFHLYDVQLINRVTWDNIIIPPDATELGWKDTVRIAPLEDTIVALRPIIPSLPWELPNAIRPLSPMMPIGSMMGFNNVDPQGNPTAAIINDLVNYGWEYVYHCHILSHEEMDMMRPVSVAVPPVAPNGLSFDSNSGILTWNDNSIAETAYVVQKSVDGGVTWNVLDTIPSPLDQANTTSVRTYTDLTFDPNIVAIYQVVAKNTVGYGAEFPSMTVQSVSEVLTVDLVPPVAPSNLVATYQAELQVLLSWTDNSSTETGYVVERSVDGGLTFSTLATLGANATSYTDTSVQFESTYVYQVVAFNLAGNSTPSNQATITTPLATPTGLTATYQAGPQIQLAWTDNSNAETGYAVERSINGGAFSLLATLGVDSVSYTDVDVTLPDSVYTYQVYAFDGTGSSAFSNLASASTLPNAPTSLAATYGAGQVSLIWVDNAASETGFVVERSTDGVTFSPIATLGANTSSYTDAAIAPETTYTYQVYAFNASGNSGLSNTATVTTPLPAPSSLSLAYQAGPQMLLTWVDNATTETSYVVERNANGGGFSTLMTLPASSTSYLDTTVVFDATYTYRVYATNTSGSSPFSNEASITTPPTEPSNVTAAASRQGNRARVVLSWTDTSTKETGFVIQYALDANFSQNLVQVTVGANSTTYNTGLILTRNTSYYFRIQSVNATGASAWVNASPFPVVTP